MDNGISVQTSIERPNSIYKIYEYDNPYTTITNDNAPEGYEFKWTRYALMGKPDLDNLEENQFHGIEAFIAPPDWMPRIMRSEKGLVTFGGLILSIRRKENIKITQSKNQLQENNIFRIETQTKELL